MKQCDRDFSPFASPFAIASSSSLSFPASESDPEDSFWRDFTFDFSFLASDDHMTGLHDDADATTVRKAEESELYGLAANPRSMKHHDLGIRKCENSDSNLKLRNFLDLSCVVHSKPSPSLAVVSTNRFDSNVTMVDGVTSITPLGNDSSGSNGAEGACLAKVLVSKGIDGSDSSALFSKTSKSSVPCDQDDAEVDSPCWRGTRSHGAAASGTQSLTLRHCSDDINVLYGLNPLAPQFIPSSAKYKLDKNGTEFKDDGSSSLKRSLSSTFPPSSGEFGTTDPSEAGVEQESSQKNRTGLLIYDADESSGLVYRDSVSTTMSVLDSSSQFQTSKKLDPLAPVFVPANAKLSSVVYEKHGVADHRMAIETNSLSTYDVSSSDDMLLNCVKAETHSSEVGHSFRSPYSDNVHGSGKTYSFNPRFGSQVQISENTKLDSCSNRTHGSKKLNPLAPQFSLADTKPKVYSSEKKQTASVNSSVLFSPIGLPQSSVHVEPSVNEICTKLMGHHRPNTSHGNSSPQMDVKKLLATIHGLSELLTHVHGTETSVSPNEQDLDLINCTVQNLNSYINNRVQEHTRNYSSAVHSSCDFKSSPKVVDNHHQAEEQINPQVFFYRSLWLKAKADRSLMEYETFLSKTRNLSN